MSGILKVLAIVCSLSPSPKESSSELIAKHVLNNMEELGAEGTIIRAVDYNILPGVQTNMGKGDEWPKIRQMILESDILILSTPIWVGHPSSVAQRIIERLDAELSESNEDGKLLTYDKIATVAVVGNEDGAHKVIADMFQALNDVGFSIPASGSTYWVGEAMNKKDYKDLDKVPDIIAQTTRTLATNAIHLASLLKQEPYGSITNN